MARRNVCRSVLRSSFIELVCYDRATEALTLRLRGDDFSFSVGPRVVDELLKAPSMGKFFNAEIKDD